MAAKIKKLGMNVKFKPMTGKDVLVDLIGRTIVIMVFNFCRLLLGICLNPLLATVVQILTESLLVSFYCFEYKTAAAGVDTPTGLSIFEK